MEACYKRNSVSTYFQRVEDGVEGEKHGEKDVAQNLEIHIGKFTEILQSKI